MAQPPKPAPPLTLPQLELPTPAAEDDDGRQKVGTPLSDAVRRRAEDAYSQPYLDRFGRPLPPASTKDPILNDVLRAFGRCHPAFGRCRPFSGPRRIFHAALSKIP